MHALVYKVQIESLFSADAELKLSKNTIIYKYNLQFISSHILLHLFFIEIKIKALMTSFVSFPLISDEL